ncbi:MAG: glycosyltransferase [Paludibacteraceae bacterium]|nr:glycosyltransferase [Paludibacteraceae bacterium]
MKVLWFEITTPKRYACNAGVLGGWQDSLEEAVMSLPEVELCVAFESNNPSDTVKKVDGITYIPMHFSYSLWDKIKSKVSWSSIEREVKEKSLAVIQSVNPDIIHVFGCEWPYGSVAPYTSVPVVIHIQGAIVPYDNALYPPKYNIWNYIKALKFNAVRILAAKLVEINNRNRAKMECRIWQDVSNYMGRTNWDHALSNVMHPGRSYYHVDETLRPLFLSSQKVWQYEKREKVKIFTTGCTTFWKGPDMMLKTAKILKHLGLDFEWSVAGHFPATLKKVVEYTEKTKFEENNVIFTGPLQPQELLDELVSSTLYVHTAYVENSPNSICEAQCLGVPVISTNVGGISTLLQNGECGYMVPANDPWQMANAIIQLSSDEKRMSELSRVEMQVAKTRHDVVNIRGQLMACYKDVIEKKNA